MFNLKVGSKVSQRIIEAGIHRAHMLGIPVFPCDSRIVYLAPIWPHVRVEHQVPHLARTYFQFPICSPQRRIHHLLVVHDSTDVPGTQNQVFFIAFVYEF